MLLMSAGSLDGPQVYTTERDRPWSEGKACLFGTSVQFTTLVHVIVLNSGTSCHVQVHGLQRPLGAVLLLAARPMAGSIPADRNAHAQLDAAAHDAGQGGSGQGHPYLFEYDLKANHMSQTGSGCTWVGVSRSNL